MDEYYQDNTFVFNDFNGLLIEKLVVCEKIETNEPIIVYLKVQNKNWCQFFLDAGIGFWESWEEIDEMKSDTEYVYLDKTNEFEITNSKILEIYCKPDCSNSQICIDLEDKIIILKCIDSEIFDSECELTVKDNYR